MITTSVSTTLQTVVNRSTIYFSQSQNNYYYGRGDYNEQNYNTGQGQNYQSDSTDSPLIDTGTAIIIIITLASTIIFASIFVKFFRRKPRKDTKKKSS